MWRREQQPACLPCVVGQNQCTARRRKRRTQYFTVNENQKQLLQVYPRSRAVAVTEELYLFKYLLVPTQSVYRYILKYVPAYGVHVTAGTLNAPPMIAANRNTTGTSTGGPLLNLACVTDSDVGPRLLLKSQANRGRHSDCEYSLLVPHDWLPIAVLRSISTFSSSTFLPRKCLEYQGDPRINPQSKDKCRPTSCLSQRPASWPSPVMYGFLPKRPLLFFFCDVCVADKMRRLSLGKSRPFSFCASTSL